MRRLIGVSLLVAACIALSSAEVQAQKKKAANGQPAIAVDSDKLTSGEYVGILRSVPGSDRKFNLEVQVPGAAVGNVGNANRIAQLQLQIQQAQLQYVAARTPQQRQHAMNHLNSLQRQAQRTVANSNKAAGKGGKTNVPTKEIEFQASEKVVVRTMLLPSQFDEKGNPKKFTREELNALKGKDKTALGYECSLDQLENGQKVRVVLAVAPAKKPEADKEKDKDKDDPAAADKRRQVKMIVVLEEAKAADGPAAKGKKK